MLWVSLVLDICSERKGYESSHGEWLTLEESFVESKKQICLCKNIDMQTVTTRKKGIIAVEYSVFYLSAMVDIPLNFR